MYFKQIGTWVELDCDNNKRTKLMAGKTKAKSSVLVIAAKAIEKPVVADAVCQQAGRAWG